MHTIQPARLRPGVSPSQIADHSQDAAAAGVVDGMLRIAVGLEDPADLCDDLDQALSTI